MRNGKYELDRGYFLNGQYLAYRCTAWFKNDVLHREDGPAMVWITGDKEWIQNGRFHRIGAPAVECFDGYRAWWKDGVRHREDGPAVIYKDGGEEWWRDGLLHREDGPALIWVDSSYGAKSGNYPSLDDRQWWILGRQMTEDEFVQWQEKNRLKEHLQMKLGDKQADKKNKI